MSLIAMIDAKRSIFDDTDVKWRQFVLDHRDEIKARSDLREISADLMALNRYNLVRYLNYVDPGLAQIAWVVRVINAMPSDVEFVRIAQLHVPPLSVMHEFYDRYSNSLGSK